MIETVYYLFLAINLFCFLSFLWWKDLSPIENGKWVTLVLCLWANSIVGILFAIYILFLGR